MLRRELLLSLALILLVSTFSVADSDWLLDGARAMANRNAVPVWPMRPAVLPLPPMVGFSQPEPEPKAPSGLSKEEMLKVPIAPFLIPQHSVVRDESIAFETAFVQTAAPTRLKTFPGLTERRFFPPDSNIAAGPTRVVLVVNTSIAIYTKAGSKVFEALLKNWYSRLPEASRTTLFDPKILFDQYARHFILVVAGIRDSDQRSWCFLSVSKTSDPQGDWALYALDMTLDGAKRTKNFADFPGLGIDDKAIYLTANMFRFGTEDFAYAKLRLLNKAQVYKFGKIGFVDFVRMKDVTGVLTSTLQPAHSFGTTVNEFMVSCSDVGGTKITLWRVTNPVTSPALLKKGVTVSSFQAPPDASQKGNHNPLNTSDCGFRANAVFQNGFVYTVQTISHDFGSGKVAVVRLYQLTTGGVVLQEITYGADKLFYFYPALMPDSRGNLILVFNRSSISEFVSIRYTGRTATQALGILQNSALLKASGTGYEALDDSNRNRFGDYSGIDLDADDSVWIYAEFALNGAEWSTQVGRVKY